MLAVHLGDPTVSQNMITAVIDGQKDTYLSASSNETFSPLILAARLRVPILLISCAMFPLQEAH